MKSLPLLSFVALLALAPAARATLTEKFAQTYPLAADGVISLENVNGDIEIVAWDKAEVSLEAEKRAKTAEELAQVTLEIDSSPAKLTVRTKYAKTGWLHRSINAAVHYKLMVPAGARLDKIDSVNSDITVTGVHGAVKLATVNGTVTARGLMADARLDSVNGELQADFVALTGVQEVKLDSVNGRAELTLPKGASAGLQAGSVNGRVTIDQEIKLGHAGRHSINGNIGGGGGPRISLDTVNGSIAVRER